MNYKQIVQMIKKSSKEARIRSLKRKIVRCDDALEEIKSEYKDQYVDTLSSVIQKQKRVFVKELKELGVKYKKGE